MNCFLERSPALIIYEPLVVFVLPVYYLKLINLLPEQSRQCLWVTPILPTVMFVMICNNKSFLLTESWYFMRNNSHSNIFSKFLNLLHHQYMMTALLMFLMNLLLYNPLYLTVLLRVYFILFLFQFI